MSSKPSSSPTPADRITLAKRRADIARYRELRAQVKPLEDEMKAIYESIKAEMNAVGASTGYIGRETVATFTTTTRESVDVKQLKAEQPELARKYMVTRPVRSFRITDPA